MNFGLGLKRLNTAFWCLIHLACLSMAVALFIRSFLIEGFGMLGLAFAAWVAHKLCRWIIEGFWGQ